MSISILQRCLVSVLWVGTILVLPFTSHAFFTSIQTAPEQSFGAAAMQWESFTLPTELAVGTSSAVVPLMVQPTANSAPAQYQVTSVVVDGPAWCAGLELYYTNETGVTAGAIADFATLPSTDFGLHSLQIIRPVTTVVPTESGECVATLTFSLWQANRPTQSGSFFDELTHTVVLAVEPVDEEVLPLPTVEQVVLNEIYPTPLATTTEPLDREWIELFNDSATAIDIAGWQIGEETSSGAETRHTIDIASVHTCVDGSKIGFARPWNEASTVVSPGGFIVIEFCALNRLRNGGDVVRLYDAEGMLRDEYEYGVTVAGKSHARIPDGGVWVDPVPTPGTINVVTRAELEAEGWDDAAITAVKQVVIDYDAAGLSKQVDEANDIVVGDTMSAEQMQELTDEHVFAEESPLDSEQTESDDDDVLPAPDESEEFAGEVVDEQPEEVMDDTPQETDEVEPVVTAEAEGGAEVEAAVEVEQSAPETPSVEIVAATKPEDPPVEDSETAASPDTD